MKPGGDFHMLSLEEIEQAMKEWRQYFVWQEVRDFARNLFGESAYEVRLDYQSEYNDEGGTYYYVRHAEVYDQTGRQLSYDFTAPFWQGMTWDTDVTPLEVTDQELRKTLGEEAFACLSAEELQRLRCKAADDHWIVDLEEHLSRLRKYVNESYFEADEHFRLERQPALTFPELYCWKP